MSYIYPSNNVIYRISNTVNDKVYIGQSIDHSRRWTRHIYDTNNGSEFAIHRAMRKHGIENFKFDPIFHVFKEDDLDWAEIELIKQWDCCVLDGRNKGYNGTRGGDGMSGELSSKIQNALVDSGKHHFLGKHMNEKLKETGKHYWIGEEGAERARQREHKKIKEGTHHFLTPEAIESARQRIKDQLASGTSILQQENFCKYCQKNIVGLAYYNYHDNNCKHNPEYCARPAINTKFYAIKHPELCENWFPLKNMREFCKNNNLDESNMYAVASGHRHRHRNWICKRITEQEYMFMLEQIK